MSITDTEYGQQLIEEKKKAQDAYIKARSQGMGVQEAAKVAGRSGTAIRKWRYDEPGFEQREQRAVAMGADPFFEDEDSFAYRRKRFFGHDSPWHHRRMVEAIEETGDRETTVIICPPEAAKTTMLADLTTDTIARNPNFRTCFVTAGQPLAKKIANQIKNRLTDTETFEDFIEQYGPFKPESRAENKPWAVTHFTVKQATHDEKECTVEALGVGSSIYGGRYNRIVFDDAQDLKKGLLNPSTDHVMTTFRQMSASRIVKGGSMFVLGSRLEEGDFYERLLDEEAYNNLVFIEALYYVRDGEMTYEPAYIEKREHYTGGRGTGEDIELVPGLEEHVTSYWPEWHSLLDLALIRDAVGEEAWFRAYMQRPQQVAAKAFSDEALNLFRDRKQEHKVEEGVQILACDPAFVAEAGFVGLRGNENHLRVNYVEEIRGLGNTDGLAGHLDHVCSILAQRGKRPDVILIDSDFYANLHDDSRVEGIARKWSAELLPHETGNSKKRADIGISRVPSSMLAGEMTIPYHTEVWQSEAAALLNECKKWRPDVAPKHLKQNLVIGMWMGWHYWTENVRDTFVSTAPAKRLPKWVRRMGERNRQIARSLR